MKTTSTGNRQQPLRKRYHLAIPRAQSNPTRPRPPAAPRKLDLATRLKRCLQEKTLLIPPCPMLFDDLYSRRAKTLAINFTVARKLDLATRLKRCLQEKNLLIPPCPMLFDDLYSMRAKTLAINFTAARKLDLATRLKRCLQEETLLIPPCPILFDDLYSMRAQHRNNATLLKAQSNQHNADRFWAIALAIFAAQKETPFARVRSVRNDARQHTSFFP